MTALLRLCVALLGVPAIAAAAAVAEHAGGPAATVAACTCGLVGAIIAAAQLAGRTPR